MLMFKLGNFNGSDVSAANLFFRRDELIVCVFKTVAGDRKGKSTMETVQSNGG